MPSTPLQELFSQGLVTSRPSHMLSPGELTEAYHTVYRENNIALQRAPDHGYYCPENLSTILGGQSVLGLFSTNFDSEETPDQLIAKVGIDLAISGISGASNNTFSPLTSPGKVIGTIGATPSVDAVVFSTSSATVPVPSGTTAFNGIAIVGRAVASWTCCPVQENYVIIAVNYTGANVSSIVLNAVPKYSGTERLFFAPPFTVTPSVAVFYNESIGFSARPVDDTQTLSNTVTANLTNSGTHYISPTTTGDLNSYAVLGRKVSGVNVSGYIRTIFYDGSGNVTHIYGPTCSLTGTGQTVVFEPHGVNITITAVGGVSDNGTIPAYDTCYFNWFPSPGNYQVVFDAGLGRQYLSSESSIDGLSWDGTSFLWDGTSPIKRISYRPRTSFHYANPLAQRPVYRPAGLKPVTVAPTISRQTNLTTGQPAWNALLPTGTYWFLITEAFIPSRNQLTSDTNPLLSNDLLESAYLAKGSVSIPSQTTVGRPIPVTITNTATDWVRITLPAPANNGSGGYLATHWAVYIAQGSDNDVEAPPLTSFHRTHLTAITRQSAGQVIDLRDAQLVQGPLKPYASAAVSGRNSFVIKRGYTPHLSWTMGNVNNDLYYIGGPTTDYMVSESGAEGITLPANKDAAVDFLFRNDDTTAIGSGPTYTGKTLVGIEVGIAAATFREYPYRTAGYLLGVKTAIQTGMSPGLHETADKHGDWAYSCPPFHTYGSPTDMWGLDNTTMDKSTLRVRVEKSFSNKLQSLGIYYGATGYEGIHLTLYWTGTSVNLNGPVYKCVTYRAQVGSLDVSDPAMLPPPTASIGDSFQGSLVVNDVNAPSFIKYSMPDKPEQFPLPYRMRMGTKRKGKVTAIKSFKNVLIVGMERAIKRVNYLPKETDTDFISGVGISHEDIAVSHGIVGPNAIAEFDMPGLGATIAYVSTTGLRMTNGSDTRALNTDVVLKDYVHEDYWEQCLLKVYPLQKWIVLYYVPKGSTHGIRSKSLVFSFSEDHIKGASALALTGLPALTGPLPVTGPNDCYVVDATDIIIDSVPQIATTDGEFVYIEDSSEESTPVLTTTSDEDSDKVQRINAPKIKSRDIFPGGMTMDSNIGSIYLLHETKGTQYVRTDATSSPGSTTITFISPPGVTSHQVGERLIHGGWDSVVTVLEIPDDYSVIVSSPAARALTADATFDTGNIMVRINAAQFGEDPVPVVTEYRSTSVGVGQTFLMDATANRFSIEISKIENPNTGQLNDINSDMSIIGVTYHALATGETNLHVN